MIFLYRIIIQRDKMNENFICPVPNRWNEIYKNLCMAYEQKLGQKLLKTGTEIFREDGPPIPLILNGWVYSDDSDKKKRWDETIAWAEKHGLLHLTIVDEADRCYFAGYTSSGGIDFYEYCEYTNNIINRFHLEDYVTLEQYILNQKMVSKLPNTKGVYFVVYPYEWPDGMFVDPGCGGHFKGRDPNVDIEKLWLNWVEGADILYIGRAGGITQNEKESNSISGVPGTGTAETAVTF
jgi:hypothetical protein